MFFKKKNKEVKIPTIEANILLIPEEFYGGKDPVIHYHNADASKPNKPAAAPLKQGNSPKLANFFKNKTLVYSLMGFLFLVVVGGITWYYLKDAGIFNKPVENTPTPPVINTENNNNETTSTTVEVPTSTTEIPTSTSPVVTSTLKVLEFPSTFLTNSADLDNDSLTDNEEAVFGTDSGIWDTDQDGYYDGQEIYNLYNPKGIAPMKLVDSGVVLEYVNPNWQYRLYYPTTWQVGAVDSENRQVLFSAADGDYIEVDVIDKNPQETFEEWFTREAVGQKYPDLQDFTNRFKEDVKKRNDDLVAYFIETDKVVVLTYHTGSAGFINYRHIMQMMMQSFRPSKTLVEIPDQVILPGTNPVNSSTP